MMNVTKLYANDILNTNENSCLYFQLGENKYAVKVEQVMEIMKLPLLDYPQRLPNNIIGLLNYNNFSINVLDLRFYLDIKVTPYNISNQVLVVKTDETMFGLIIDKVEDIISIDETKVEHLASKNSNGIIDYLYKNDAQSISVINLNAIENILKESNYPADIDITSLFPTDDESRYKLMQRSIALQEKFKNDLDINMFSKDKFISLFINNSTYCLNLEHVKEFLKDTPITPVPCELDYIAGIITLRGDFVTIIDTAVFLGLGKANQSQEKGNIVVVQTQDYCIGFLVDEILNIIEIPEDIIEENAQKHEKFIISEIILNEKLYSILNLKEILLDERLFVEESF